MMRKASNGQLGPIPARQRNGIAKRIDLPGISKDAVRLGFRMRDALLVVIVGVICLSSVTSANVGFYGYIWFALLRPDLLAFSRRPFSLVFLILTFIGSLRFAHRYVNILRSPITLGLVLLQIPIFVSTLTAVYPELCTHYYSTYIKVVIASLLVPIFTTDEKVMRNFLLVISFSLGFLAMKFAVFGIIHGGLIFKTGEEGGMLSDNNGLALAMGMLLPIAWYSRLMVTQKHLRLALNAIAGAAVITVISTNSRGNSLAMGVVILILILRSRRKIAALIGIAVLALPAFLLVGTRYVARMSTLNSKDFSAVSRVEFAAAAYHMWQDYMAFGVGFGQANYVVLSPKYLGHSNDEGLVVHDTYLQMLVDSGVFAFVLYTSLTIGTVIWLGFSARKMRRFRPDLVVVPHALQCGLLHFALASLAYSRNDFEFYHILLTAAGAWQLIAWDVYAKARQSAPQVSQLLVRSPWAMPAVRGGNGLPKLETHGSVPPLFN
jgi:probable O-glycosylation ligase (exosortase A-associated)